MSIEEGERLSGHRAGIRAALSENPRTIVILDDDPTGTQTVHDIPVVTEWSEKVLEKELLTSPVFFILTNSRSLQADAANALGKLIGKRLQKIAQKHHKDLLLVSRGDSTLRGHYPNEVNAMAEGLGWANAKHLLIPAFFEGGRYTYNDIHYVREGDEFIPAAKTPFASDNTFGYTSSDLKDWIMEKTKDELIPNKIAVISIDTLRNESAEHIKSILEQSGISHIVVNATSHNDLQAIAHAALQSKGRLIYRTAASFVNAISGIEPKPCLGKNEILANQQTGGALIIVGSYVPKTTQQLNHLKENYPAVFLELDVSKVLKSYSFKQEIAALAKQLDSHLESADNVVLYTSRDVIKGTTKAKSLEIVNLVSNALINIVKQLTKRPKYIVAKGGITSSDIATKALSVKRAIVLGQAIKGVPVWKLGGEAKFPDMPYIVFPGNVGDASSLYELLKQLE